MSQKAPVPEPCPDCGRPAVLVENSVRGFWEVRCRHCPTFVWDDTAEAAAARWARAVSRTKTPIVRVKPVGAFYALHVTYTDDSTQHAAYYDTEAQAEHVATTLRKRWAKDPPAATVETDVLFVIDTVLELGGQLRPKKG